jgi:hypothetical protein
MKHDTTVVDSLFNPGRSGNVGIFCDRQLVLGGSYSFWGSEDVTFTRSLRGCVLKNTTNGYPNGTDTIGIHQATGTINQAVLNSNDQYCRDNDLYVNVNQQQPAVTITYDSRYSLNTPDWMKENRVVRTEVQ